MVGVARIELATPAMSRHRSHAHMAEIRHTPAHKSIDLRTCCYIVHGARFKANL